jgi:hypothetical protein
METDFDLYGLITEIYNMVIDFSSTFYELLTFRITIPYAIWKAWDVTTVLDLPRSFTLISFLGGVALGAVVFASIVKAVNFLT